MIIKYRKFSTEIVDKITNMIENGELKPGHKFSNEMDFSKELGISRGVLREALNILQEKGYVERKPGLGTVIKNSVDFKEKLIFSIRNSTYFEVLDAREAIEQKIVELIIKNVSDNEIIKLETEIFIDKKSNFHLKLAESCGNEILLNFIRFYINMITEVGEKSYELKGRYEKVEEEHAKIFEAIKSRDIFKAQVLIKDHFNNLKSLIRKTDNIKLGGE